MQLLDSPQDLVWHSLLGICSWGLDEADKSSIFLEMAVNKQTSKQTNDRNYEALWKECPG